MYKPESITIIGGYGALGKWFARFFHSIGWQVLLYGRNTEKLTEAANQLGVKKTTDLKFAVSNTDVVWISIPIPETAQIISEIAVYARDQTTIIEIASIKAPIIEQIKIIKQYNLNFLSIHPMFGPGATSLDQKKMLFILQEPPSETFQYFWNLFAQNGANCVITSGIEHDQIMASVLGGAHFINMFFVKCLEIGFEGKIDLEILKKFGGTTFSLQKTISEAVLQENPHIYAPIQMENPYFLERLEKLYHFLGEYIQIIKSKNLTKFIDIFKGLQNFAKTDNSFASAYEIFYRLLSQLT
jgi:prephenate dehydrogenase